MLIEVYTCGRTAASFAPRPGYRRRWLVVPGGSELQDTKLHGRSHTFLFCPTADPCQMAAWSARGAVRDGPLLVGPGPGKNKGPDEARRDE
ncbi:MAG: hypothetical protein JO034_19645 [Singulisphaera sp.]|nr:hypothetical protein [Singulisphaera sp.]